MNDRIETLLRTTGRRATAPAESAARVQAAVGAHWRAEVARRRRRRRRWATAGLLSAATVLAAVALGTWRRTPPPPSGGIGARVEQVVRAAWARSTATASAAPAALAPGDPIAMGTELATEGNGRLALRVASGHSVRLDAGTRLRVLADGTLALDAGAVYVDSRGLLGSAQRGVEIRTPLGTVRDIGTQFEARLLDGSLRIRVREGTASLAGPTSEVAVSAGQELQVGGDGGTTRRERAIFGAEWAWIDDVTPMMELGGRSLQDFLDWIARERGLRLRFASPALAAAAPGIVLNGSIDGMTLDEALESVLPTCRMLHRVEGDALVIRADESS